MTTGWRNAAMSGFKFSTAATKNFEARVTGWLGQADYASFVNPIVRGWETGVVQKIGKGAMRSLPATFGFMHRGGAEWGWRGKNYKWLGEGFGGKLGGVAGLLMSFSFAAQGFREEGAWGAIKNIGQDAFYMALGGAIGFLPMIAITMLPMVPTAAIDLMEYGNMLTKQKRQLEFGGRRMDDPFGNLATARQRSLMSIQNSHLAVRNALGNEAMYLHMR